MGKIDVYSHTEDTFNSDTGEITNSTTHKARKIKSTKEDDYIKVYKYTNTLFAFKDIPLTYVPFVIEIGRYMSYAQDGQIVILNKYVKEQVAAAIGVKLDRVNKVVKDLKKYDVLRPTESRGVYAVNPFVIGCGDSVKIEELRAQFDYNADRLIQTNVSHNMITGKTIETVIEENKNIKKALLQKK